MRRRSSTFAAVLRSGPAGLVLLALAGTSGCGGDASAPPAVAIVAVEPASATVLAGASTQFSAMVRGSDGQPLTGHAVGWGSGNSAVASVSATGLVTGVAPGGPVSITASCEGKSGSAQVTVLPVVATVTVTPAASTLRVGGTVQLKATVKDAQGNTLTDQSASWASSAPAVATVSAGGLVTGVSGGGPVTITATSEGKSGSAQVIVEGPVATVTVTPDSVVLAMGHELQLLVTVRDAQQRVLAFRTVTWTSSNTALATVSSGLVQGIAAGGPVTITATSEGVSGTARVTVLSVLPLSLPSGDAVLDAKLYQAPGGGTHPTFVFGPTYEADVDQSDIAAAVQREGWNALLFNYRGTLASTGLFSFANALADWQHLLAALRAPAARAWGVAADRIVIGGHGAVGGGFALLAAAADSTIAHVAAVAPGNSGTIARRAAADAAEWARGLQILAAPTLGTSPSVRLLGTAEELLQEMIEHADELDLILAAPRLAGRKVLLVTASAGERAPGYEQAPLLNALTAAGVTVTAVMLDTDLRLLTARQALAAQVTNWLRTCYAR